MLPLNTQPDLPRRLAERLQQPLPGREAQCRFEPELSFGRHYEPAPPDARRAAVVALLYPHEGVWHVPLTVRPGHMAKHAGQVSLPGGMIEPGEASFDAALRELREELGVAESGVEAVGRLSDIYVFVSNFCVTPWIAAVAQRPNFRPSPAEVETLLEVPLAHLLDPAHVGSHVHETGNLRFRAPHIDFDGHRIWGATSMMIAELAQVLCDVRADAPGATIAPA